MRIRHSFLAAALAALLAAPIAAVTLTGKVVAVDENSITVMKDGRSTVYVLPPDLEIQAKDQQETVDLTALEGRTVTLTVDDAMHGQAQGQKEAHPRVTNLRIDGDLEVDSETEIDRDTDVEEDD